MKSYLMVLPLLFVGLSSNLWGATIKDVKPSDPAYSSIQKVVNEGIVDLQKGDRFRSNQSVSRKEMAVTVDRLIQKLDRFSGQLSQTEIDELAHLAKNFKAYLISHETNFDSVSDQLGQLQAEQTSQIHELSRLNETLQADIQLLKKQSKQQQMGFIIGGVGLVGLMLIL